ncbi:hypothetical protein [Streptomyces sp. NPDC050528]|uniref:hypothetical protein n=1 Tax=unclassified Streptomyces TaxID=2593676 RepID=UPI0037A596E2
MKKLARFGLVGVASALFVGFAASPSQAVTVHTAECSATGSSGSVITTGWDYNDRSIPNLTLTVRDTLTDGHHASIRLLVQYTDSVGYYPWHANYNGAGSTVEFNSYVPTGGTIFDVGLQVGTFEGDDLKYYCTQWVSD